MRNRLCEVLWIIIGASIFILGFPVLWVASEAHGAVPEIRSTQMPKHLEVVLGASLGASKYSLSDCEPSCNRHEGNNSRWGLKAQLVSMKHRKTHGLDFGLEVGISDTLNGNMNAKGDVRDRIYHLVPLVRVPVYKKPGIKGSVDLYGGAGISRVKTRFAMNDDDIHTDTNNGFVALGGVQLLLSKHVTLAFELRHDNLGNATFQSRRDCEKPRSLSLDREMNTVSAVLEWHI